MGRKLNLPDSNFEPVTLLSEKARNAHISEEALFKSILHPYEPLSKGGARVIYLLRYVGAAEGISAPIY
jgi:hypothetical protein